MSLALLTALAVATAVNIYIARRIGRSVLTIADAASDVASGHYDVRVNRPGLGAEFDALASGFNQMAGRVGSVEQTRRRLLTDLGHQMRTPVATLEGYLEALEDGVATLDAARNSHGLSHRQPHNRWRDHLCVRHRRWHPRRAPAPCLRTLLPGGHRA